jgi:hypothetical protein
MLYIFWIVVFILIVSMIPIIILFKALFVGHLQELVLFSPLRGLLTYAGKPAAGAKIIRKVVWKDKTGETEFFYANNKGEFQLPIKISTTRIPAMAQFVAHQSIDVVFNDQEFAIWHYGKMDRELYSELGGRAVNLTCELTDDLIRVEMPNGGLGTSCKWDSIEKINT